MNFTDEELEEYLHLRGAADDYLRMLIRHKRMNEYSAGFNRDEEDQENISEAYNAVGQ